LQQRSSAADVSLTRFLNRLSSCYYQQTSFALIGHSQRAELDSAANSTEKRYSEGNMPTSDRALKNMDTDLFTGKFTCTFNWPEERMRHVSPGSD
jgi:hypothetical protein